jgi:putative ABC transport system permease protein
MFSGFTDLIDGIILNMKFGGWLMSFSLLVGGFELPTSCLFQSKNEQFNGIQKICGAKKQIHIVSVLVRSHYIIGNWWNDRLVF